MSLERLSNVICGAAEGKELCLEYGQQQQQRQWWRDVTWCVTLALVA